MSVVRLSGFSLTYRRLPQGSDKQNLLGVIDRASRFVRLPRLLACIGISSSRYYDWKNAQECGPDDVPPNDFLQAKTAFLGRSLESHSARASDSFWHISRRSEKQESREIWGRKDGDCGLPGLFKALDLSRSHQPRPPLLPGKP
jgi:hypothetical protein